MAINLGSTAVSDFKLGDTQVDKICLGDTVVWQKAAPGSKGLKFSSSGAQTLGIVTANLGTISPNFEYSTDDGATWTTWDVSQTIAFGEGTDLYLRGMNTFLAKAGTNYTQFVFSTASPVECSGNIMHLFDYTQDLDTIPDDAELSSRGMKYMFQNCTALTTAPDLPATNIVRNCYFYMFDGCTNLTTAPASLPSLTALNSCYSYMFQNCTSLTAAPALPATTLGNYCYRSMFYGCTSLTSIPALPATTLSDACYDNMFEGCSLIKMSLTQEGEYQNTYTFGASPSGHATYMFANTGGTFTGTVPPQTLYTSNTIIS